MKRALVAALLVATATPALAWDRLTTPMCQDSYERFALMMSEGDRGHNSLRAQPRLARDGWCEVAAEALAQEVPKFDLMRWRAEDLDRWTDDGIPPIAVQVQITGLDPDEMEGAADTGRPDVTFDVTLRQMPDAGQVIVEQLTLSNDAGDRLLVSGLFERLFLGSQSMLQVSVGSMTFKAGLVSLTLEGTHENPFGFRFDATIRGGSDAQGAAAFDLVSNLPDDVIDAATRAELTAFARDLPKPVGTLEVQADSERGLGLMQVGAAVAMQFSELSDPDATADARVLAIILDGMTIRADWTPAAQVAD